MYQYSDIYHVPGGLGANSITHDLVPAGDKSKGSGNNLIRVPLPASIPNLTRVGGPGGPGGLKDGGSPRSNTGHEFEVDGDEIGDEDDGSGKQKRKLSKIGRGDFKNMTQQQKVERRQRNREHAKSSRIRKKVLLDSLQDQLQLLRVENSLLRQCVADKIPHKAQNILEECTTEESLLLSGVGESSMGQGLHINTGEKAAKAMVFNSLGQPIQQGAQLLVEPDFRLIQALITSQQNFVVSDPSLPDNPIVYASEGFCKLSGYKRAAILGRNCRFLQGPGTDQNAVDIIRKGVEEGCDISVCLLNYKADGSPFWNQFFVAALKDSNGAIVNYVGVQCEVNTLPISDLKDRVKRLPMPDSM